MTIITNALVYSKDCFLTRPSWDFIFKACPNISPLGRELWLTIARIPDFLNDVRKSTATNQVHTLTTGMSLCEQLLSLDDPISADLSDARVFNLATELYEGLTLSTSPSAPEGTETSHGVIHRVALLCASLLMVIGALRRPPYTNPSLLNEENRARDWLCATVPVALHLGRINGLFFTVGGAVAFEISDHAHRAMNVIAVLALYGDYELQTGEALYQGMQRMCDAMTGGDVVAGL